MTIIQIPSTAQITAQAAINRAQYKLGAAEASQQAIEANYAREAREGWEAVTEAEDAAAAALREGDRAGARERMRTWAHADEGYVDEMRKWERHFRAAERETRTAREKYDAARDALVLAERGWGELETYAQMHGALTDALAAGEGLRVELDAGTFDLWGEELREVWEALAPGEGFGILAVLVGP